MGPEDHHGRSCRTTTGRRGRFHHGRPVDLLEVPRVPIPRAPSPSPSGVLYAVVGALVTRFRPGDGLRLPADYVIEWLFVGALVLAVGVLVQLARVND